MKLRPSARLLILALLIASVASAAPVEIGVQKDESETERRDSESKAAESKAAESKSAESKGAESKSAEAEQPSQKEPEGEPQGEPERAPSGAGVLVLDRAVARFSAPEGGGRRRPYFIYQRELAFEARLVALSDSSHRVTKAEPYRRHHLQVALERYVAETLLSALTIDPAPSPEQIEQQLESARFMIMDEVGGETAFVRAAEAEGMGILEMRRYFRRRALSSLYLDAMVAPMLSPSALELRRVHRRGEGPLAAASYEEAEPALRRWYVAQSLKRAVATYFQNARARVHLEFL